MLARLLPGLAIAMLTLVPVAHAHHPSGVASTGGGGPIATISASTLEQGTSAAAVFFEMVKVDPFGDPQLQSFAGQHLHVHSLDAILAPTLVYAYGVTNDLTVIARLPVVIRKDIREGHHSHGPAGNTVDERGGSAGVGDLTLLGQYRFLHNRSTRTEAALLLGVKTPTGRTNIEDSFGERFETEFQPGTGSWDGLFGLAMTQRRGAWSFDANVLYQLATEGALDTDLGDRFLYNVAVTYRLTGGPDSGRGHKHHEAPDIPAHTLDLMLELNGEWHGHTVEAGVRDPFSSGNVVYLSPGLRLGLDKLSSFVSVGVPVVNHVNGIQAEPTWRLMTGIAVAF